MACKIDENMSDEASEGVMHTRLSRRSRTAVSRSWLLREDFLSANRYRHFALLYVYGSCTPLLNAYGEEETRTVVVTHVFSKCIIAIMV
jgi:hypothetical protein